MPRIHGYRVTITGFIVAERNNIEQQKAATMLLSNAIQDVDEAVTKLVNSLDGRQITARQTSVDLSEPE